MRAAPITLVRRGYTPNSVEGSLLKWCQVLFDGRRRFGVIHRDFAKQSDHFTECTIGVEQRIVRRSLM